MGDQERESCRAGCETLAARAIAAARVLADVETRPDQLVETPEALASAQANLTEIQRSLINAALGAGVSMRRTAAAAGRPVATVQKMAERRQRIRLTVTSLYRIKGAAEGGPGWRRAPRVARRQPTNVLVPCIAKCGKRIEKTATSHRETRHATRYRPRTTSAPAQR